MSKPSIEDIKNWLADTATDAQKETIYRDLVDESGGVVHSVLHHLDAESRRLIGPPGAVSDEPSSLADELAWLGRNQEHLTDPDENPPVATTRRRLAIAALAAAILLMLAVPWWLSRSNASLIERVGASYTQVRRANFEAKVLEEASDSPAERWAIVDRLLPDHPRLSALFDRGTALRGSAPATRLAVAKALVGQARLRHALGQTQDDATLADLDEAKKVAEALPPSLDRELILADVALNRTAILGPQRKFEQALALLDPVIPSLEEIIRVDPSRSDARFLLARLLSNRANNQRGLTLPPSGDGDPARFAQAVANYKQAIDLLQPLVASGSTDPDALEWFSRIHGNLGLLLLAKANAGDEAAKKAAEQSLKKAVDVANELTSWFPRLLTAQDAQVAAIYNLGAWQHDMNHPEAEATLTRAMQLYDRLHAEYPESREFVWGQALARFLLGVNLSVQGKKEQARPMLEDARARYEQLVARYPDVGEIASQRELLKQILQTLE